MISEGEQPAAMELINECVTLWQDHAYREGYRSTLELIKFRDGRCVIQLSVHGKIVRLPYMFPFLERDRL